MMEPVVGHKGEGQDEERSARVYAFVCSFTKASGGIPPTAREIKQGVRLRSLRHVASSLRALERSGRIERGRFGQARSLRIVGARFLLPGEGEAR